MKEHYRCPCGLIRIVPRFASRLRPKKHKKTMWCWRECRVREFMKV
jgi:hypothetical protein